MESLSQTVSVTEHLKKDSMDSTSSTRRSSSPPGMASGMASLPSLSRQSSVSKMLNAVVGTASVDWARQITLEERQSIREKIKDGYSKRALTYEELLAACSAIEEELLFVAAPSRLDYFKSGVQYDKRIAEKLMQMEANPNIVEEQASDSHDDENPAKRTKN
jgi:acyl-CoA reductase-like NAD-dependent aldehyde dehydrogenase